MSLIGITCLLGSHWPFSAVTDSDCNIIECSKKDIIVSSQKYPELIIDLLLNRIQSLRKRTLGYSGTYIEKLARYIDLHCNDNQKISIKKTAEILGCRRETVSRSFKDLENEKAIVKERNYLLKIDRKRLRDIYEM